VIKYHNIYIQTDFIIISSTVCNNVIKMKRKIIPWGREERATKGGEQWLGKPGFRVQGLVSRSGRRRVQRGQKEKGRNEQTCR
jgi:hypothetical protein